MKELSHHTCQKLTLLGNVMAHEVKNHADKVCNIDSGSGRCVELLELIEAWEEALTNFRSELEGSVKGVKRR